MRIAICAASIALAGCQTLTPEKIGTASISDIYDAACFGDGASQEVRQLAAAELQSRGYTCQGIYQQRMNNLRAVQGAGLLNRPNSGFATTPAYQNQPYVMPTQQSGLGTQMPITTHGTLMGQRPTTSASGQAAYVCQYRTSTGVAQVVQIASEGPCPPAANLR